MYHSAAVSSVAGVSLADEVPKKHHADLITKKLIADVRLEGFVTVSQTAWMLQLQQLEMLKVALHYLTQKRIEAKSNLYVNISDNDKPEQKFEEEACDKRLHRCIYLMLGTELWKLKLTVV